MQAPTFLHRFTLIALVLTASPTVFADAGEVGPQGKGTFPLGGPGVSPGVAKAVPGETPGPPTDHMVTDGIEFPKSALQRFVFWQEGEKPSASSREPLRSSTREHWIGWLETPETQLRWLVQINRSSQGVLSGTNVTPEVSPTAIDFSKVSVDGDQWSLEWTDSISKQTLHYAGVQESPNQVVGLLTANADAPSVPLRLTKVDQFPPETRFDLGADIVWTDVLPAIGEATTPRRFDFRIRIYSKPPYVREGENVQPRILFDSVAKNIYGRVVELKQEQEGTLEFLIPSLKAEYRAVLAPTNDVMIGTFRRNDSVSPLELRILRKEDTEESKSTTPSRRSTDESKSDTPQAKSTSSSEEDSVRIKMQPAERKPRPRDLAPNETAFLIDGQDRSLRATSKPPQQSRWIGATLTMPEKTTNRPVPAVLILSTYGPNDRDGSVGANKFYRDLARWFAKRGIASLRVDDRGVGESDEAVVDHTSRQALQDISVMIESLRKNEKIDASNIGLVGHGEGADLAIRTASVDASIGFLVLLAPPGLAGSDLLLSQANQVAVADGIPATNREILQNIQKRVHEIAITNPGAPATQRQLVSELINKNWTVIASTLVDSKSEEELSELRKGLEAQLVGEVGMLDSAWNREFLTADPVAPWMMVRIPVLAMFGGNDVQVIAQNNAPPIETASARNSSAQVVFLKIPGVNHWFQPSQDGSLQGEKEPVPMSPQVTQSIDRWLKEIGR